MEHVAHDLGAIPAGCTGDGVEGRVGLDGNLGAQVAEVHASGGFGSAAPVRTALPVAVPVEVRPQGFAGDGAIAGALDLLAAIGGDAAGADPLAHRLDANSAGSRNASRAAGLIDVIP